MLARSAIRAIELEPTIAHELPAAVFDLARAARLLDAGLDGGSAEMRAAALRAAARAAAVSRPGASVPVAGIVGQVRFTATDLLQASGLDRADAVAQLRAAAAPAAVAGPERPLAP